MSDKKKFGFISLFSGAGGLDLGLKEAGFTPVLSIEKEEICRSTLISNDRNLNLSSVGDIFELSSEKIIEESGFSKRELPLLVGGPPCQPFSKSSYWANSSKSRMNDPRAQCIVEFMRVTEDLLPKVVLIENVTGIGYSDKNDGLEYVKSRFQEINKKNGVRYKPIIQVVNAADYGVPQVRKRLFIIASRDGASFELPDARFYDPEAKNKNNEGMKPYRTVWDAIGDLDTDIYCSELKPKGKWAELLPSIPEGKNYLWHTQKMGGIPLFGWRTRYWSFLLKLDKNKPSWTITASPGPATGPFHWKNRYLSTNELARLQTYPDWYHFEGSYRERQKQIGNSVPPALGELFGLEIRRQFFGSIVRKKLRFIPSKNFKEHPNEILTQVPKKYLLLANDHSDHPGVGKGPGAQRRLRVKLEREF